MPCCQARILTAASLRLSSFAISSGCRPASAMPFNCSCSSTVHSSTTDDCIGRLESRSVREGQQGFPTQVPTSLRSSARRPSSSSASSSRICSAGGPLEITRELPAALQPFLKNPLVSVSVHAGLDSTEHRRLQGNVQKCTPPWGAIEQRSRVEVAVGSKVANGTKRQKFLLQRLPKLGRSKIVLRHSVPSIAGNQFESHLLSPAQSIAGDKTCHV